MPAHANDTPVPRPPRLPALLLGAALGAAERDEVLADLAAEHAARRAADGALAAWGWAAWQALASLPRLASRSWWRGWTGFETPSERLLPGRSMLETWAIDVKFALRRLRRRPTYAALAILTLALGVAGTAAVYGVVRQLLLAPLPVPHDEQVVQFWFPGAWSEAELAYLRPSWPGFTAVAALREDPVTIRVGDAPATIVDGVSASEELFRVLGRGPALGPGFRPGDDRVGAEPVAVISDALWRRLGASPSIVGSRLELSGETRTVVGVMPPDFWFPTPSTDVWRIETVDPENRSGNYALVGRLAPGRQVATMAPELARITARLGERFHFPPQWDLTRNPSLTPLRSALLGKVEPALLALLGAMALLLLVACVDVSALMLGQVEARTTELAVRRALGATGGRLLQQLVVESLVVGGLAAVVGAALAAAGFRFLVGLLPLGPLAGAARLDWTVFAAATLVALAAATAVALAPAASAGQEAIRERLSRSRTGGVAGRGGRLEHALVVAQVALVLLLASGSALLVRSVRNLATIDSGLDVDRVAVLDLTIPQTVETARLPGLLRELTDAVAALPGVEAAGVTQRLPLRGSSDNWGVEVESRPDLTDTTTAVRVVSPDYLRAMGVRLHAGRTFAATDRRSDVAEGATIVNRAFAKRYFGDRDPLGQRIRYMERWDRIVGVVDDVAESGLVPEPVPVRYVVHEQVPFLMPRQSLVLRARTGVDPASLLDAAAAAVQRAQPSVAIAERATLRSVFRAAIGPVLPVMTLLSVVAAMGLVLGAIGIYGVVSHFATRRTRDWGIRMAVGLRPAQVAGHIVGHGARLLALGLAVGVGGFLALARVLAALLYGVGASDPLAIAAAALVLLAAGLAAAAVPALRASRMNLATVLREP